MRHAAAAVLCAGMIALSGCGHATIGPTPPPPPGSGYFAGTMADDLGVAVDLQAFDPTAQLVSRALVHDRTPTALAIVSLVNDGDTAVPVPELALRTNSDRLVPLVDAGVILARVPGGREVAARAALRATGAIPAKHAGVRYMVAVDVRPDDVVGVQVVTRTDVQQLSATAR